MGSAFLKRLRDKKGCAGPPFVVKKTANGILIDSGADGFSAAGQNQENTINNIDSKRFEIKTGVTENSLFPFFGNPRCIPPAPIRDSGMIEKCAPFQDLARGISARRDGRYPEIEQANRRCRKPVGHNQKTGGT